ncbi:MAG: DciA family protein [Ignavibacteriaceae bacterium]
MPKDFYSFAEIVNENPELSSLRNSLKKSEVIDSFYKIFPDFQKVVSAVKVEKKTLFLSAESAAWKSELKFKDQLIIEKINNHFKEERVKWIRFV